MWKGSDAYRGRDPLILPPGRVDLWWMEIDELRDSANDPEGLLDAGERERARGMREAAARQQFVAGRFLLRQLLGRYLGADPRSLTFAYGENGKPHLEGDREGGGIGFNLSHSARLVVAAFVRGAPVGVDVEALRPILRADLLSTRFFAPSETRWLQRLPPDRRERAFLHLWTSKEAILKAMGTGLSVPLREVEVSADPEAPPRLLRWGGAVGRAPQWSLLGATIRADYRCIVAVPGNGWRLEVIRWAAAGGRSAESRGVSARSEPSAFDAGRGRRS